jgi:hypothetical protein
VACLRVRAGCARPTHEQLRGRSAARRRSAGGSLSGVEHIPCVGARAHAVLGDSPCGRLIVRGRSTGISSVGITSITRCATHTAFHHGEHRWPRLKAKSPATGVVDGGWWPRSRDLATSTRATDRACRSPRDRWSCELPPERSGADPAQDQGWWRVCPARRWIAPNSTRSTSTAGGSSSLFWSDTRGDCASLAPR